MCESCGKRFTTYEKVETIPLSVIKKDQTREAYHRSKIQDGVLRACYKRPIPIEKIESMIDSIEGSIFESADKEISSTRIGEIVMEHLKDLDAVAYVRFASVYREFKDVSTFMDELKSLWSRRVLPWDPSICIDTFLLRRLPCRLFQCPPECLTGILSCGKP